MFGCTAVPCSNIVPLWKHGNISCKCLHPNTATLKHSLSGSLAASGLSVQSHLATAAVWKYLIWKYGSSGTLVAPSSIICDYMQIVLVYLLVAATDCSQQVQVVHDPGHRILVYILKCKTSQSCNISHHMCWLVGCCLVCHSGLVYDTQ